MCFSQSYTHTAVEINSNIFANVMIWGYNQTPKHTAAARKGLKASNPQEPPSNRSHLQDLKCDCAAIIGES